jgi:hypothetical protein
MELEFLGFLRLPTNQSPYLLRNSASKNIDLPKLPSLVWLLQGTNNATNVLSPLCVKALCPFLV